MSETEDYSREAFMAAIVKLADDEAFRRSFLTHYQLWLHPPMIVSSGFVDLAENYLTLGQVTVLSKEQIGEMAGSLLREIAETA